MNDKLFWANWLVGVGLVIAATTLLVEHDTLPGKQAIAVGKVLSGAADGFMRAIEPRAFVFPDDHGPHPDYKTEWWYVTGNLRTETGREFGYQVTFFRIGLRPASGMPRASAWAARQIYMAHVALTDIANETFHSQERFARDAQGLAGAQTEPFRVWLEDWQLVGDEHAHFPISLRVALDDVDIDLRLEALKGPVLHGDAGLSHKSAESGNASYYYSYTRLATSGTVRLAGEPFEVSGQSWLDREWSTSALGPDQAGWDWFSLQFDDNTELMFYRLRNKDGSTDPFSEGTYTDDTGETRRLSLTQVTMQPLSYWMSPQTQKRYPVAWHLTVPELEIDITVRAKQPNQELSHAVTYWEGAVRIHGSRGGSVAAGQGYMELAGY